MSTIQIFIAKMKVFEAQCSLSEVLGADFFCPYSQEQNMLSHCRTCAFRLILDTVVAKVFSISSHLHHNEQNLLDVKKKNIKKRAWIQSLHLQ